MADRVRIRTRPRGWGLILVLSGFAVAFVSCILTLESRPEFPISSRDFNPFAAKLIAGYEYESAQFIGVHSREHMEWIMHEIDRERRDRAIITRSGAAGTSAQFLAILLDPALLLIAIGMVLLLSGWKGVLIGGLAGGLVHRSVIEVLNFVSDDGSGWILSVLVGVTAAGTYQTVAWAVTGGPMAFAQSLQAYIRQ